MAKHIQSGLANGGAALLHTSGGSHPLALRVADTFFSRFRGLMLASPLEANQGMLLTECPSVHCAFMRQAIDVIYLDATGRVLKCVADLKPWRASSGSGGRDAQGRRHVRARHTLELAAGSIARLGIEAGDRLEHSVLQTVAARLPPATRPADLPGKRAPRRAQDGAAMVEFVVVGPVLTLLGLAALQYGAMFFAKNQINHATFMAARAGSTGNANLTSVRSAYAQALVPLYGGGQSAAELAASLVKAQTDTQANTRIALLNPTVESFADWGVTVQRINPGSGVSESVRLIPNGHQAYKNLNVGATSGQTIQDANLIKLRITHGFAPRVPIVASIYLAYMRWSDPGNDAFYTAMVNSGRIPMVSHVTLHMQSDAIKGDPISTPGPGNGGAPSDPGDPPAPTTPPPDCASISCGEPNPPLDPGTPCTGPDCPTCSGK